MKPSGITTLFFALMLTSPLPIFAANLPAAAIGTWAYDETYHPDGSKIVPQAGLFIPNISVYNTDPNTLPKSRITQVFSYGGDVEMYCNSADEDCVPKSFLTTYFNIPVSTKWNIGDSGFESTKAYQAVPYAQQTIITLDGRVDVKDSEKDYLDHLNDANAVDAAHFADKIAKTICADDRINGVQFDVEPFSFTGARGIYQGQGQQYFYEEIAKDFAGYYDGKPPTLSDPAGIRRYQYQASASKDPMNCVDKTHPLGRYFSVFTFSGDVTPSVVQAFTRHENGYVVDSLYDLGGGDIGKPLPVPEFGQLVKQEIDAMRNKGVAYQFAIPAAASAHEFESAGPTQGYPQIEYVKAALEAIRQANVLSDPNYLGIALWGWNQRIFLQKPDGTPVEFKPAYPPEDVLNYLKSALATLIPNSTQIK